MRVLTGDEVRAAGDDKGGASRRHVEPGDEERLERGLQPAGGGHQAGDEACRMMLLLLLGLRAEFPLRCTTISKFFIAVFFLLF